MPTPGAYPNVPDIYQEMVWTRHPVYLFAYILGVDDAASDAQQSASASELSLVASAQASPSFVAGTLGAPSSGRPGATAVGYVLDRYAARTRASLPLSGLLTQSGRP